MNEHIDPDEWESQEAARLKSGEGHTADARARAYNQVAHALRHPRAAALRHDFAARMAARAAAGEFSGFEKAVLAILAAVLAVSAVGTVMRHLDWQQLEVGVTAWPLALVVCLAASWTLGRLHRRAD